MAIMNSFEQVSIRLNKESSLLSEKSLSRPSEIVAELGKQIFSYLDKEELCIVNFDSKMRPINFNIASVGTINQSLFHPRELLKSSILSNAANVIVIHNHPSGSLAPSKEDMDTTKRICKTFNMMGIKVLDHIIIGGRNDRDFYSFRKSDEQKFSEISEVLDYEALNFKPLDEEILREIKVIHMSDEFTFWQNRNSLNLPLDDSEAELLLDYEDMKGQAFIVENDELKLIDVNTCKVKDCDLEEEIVGLCDYVALEVKKTEKEVHNPKDFVGFCNGTSKLEDLKMMDELCQKLYSKTSVGKNFELGSSFKKTEKTNPEKYKLVDETTESTLSKEETMDILDRHFNGCLRYWERTLGVDSDMSNEAYEHAIEEIPTNNPFKMQGEKLNEEWVNEFRQYRLMDCYGKNIPQNKGGIRR